MFNFSDPKVPQVIADRVKKAIDSGEKVILLDVRTPGEYSGGRIEGAINLPLDDVVEKVEEIIPDKQSTVFVYCLSGSRSVDAVSEMIKLGYKNVFNLSNGLLVWKVMNYPLISK